MGSDLWPWLKAQCSMDCWVLEMTHRSPRSGWFNRTTTNCVLLPSCCSHTTSVLYKRPNQSDLGFQPLPCRPSLGSLPLPPSLSLQVQLRDSHLPSRISFKSRSSIEKQHVGQSGDGVFPSSGRPGSPRRRKEGRVRARPGWHISRHRVHHNGPAHLLAPMASPPYRC